MPDATSLPTAHPSSAWRARWLYLLLVLLTIGLGLAHRHFAGRLPGPLRKEPGDALWAMMVFFGVAMLFPRWPTLRTAGAALLFSVMIEFTQLYHAPWIDTLRSYTLGHLILGSGFAWIDMAAYAVGIGIGASGQWLIRGAMEPNRVPMES